MEQSQKLPKRRIKRGWMNLKISHIFSDNASTKTLYLVDNEEGGCQFDYLPGQYITIRFDSLTPKPIVRSYTLSSSPCQQNFIALTVREVEDPFVSRFLCQTCKEGDVLRARGPIGKFVFNPKTDHPHLVMVAGGSGVTPFISIMREYSEKLGQEGAPEKMTLFVTFRSDQDLMCWKDIKELRDKANIKIIVTLSRQEKLPEEDLFIKGRVTPEVIENHLENCYEQRTYMSCGPEALMEMVTKHLREKGVEEKHIKLESFD